jgi:hypothetical protein
MTWQDLERDHRALVDAILERISAGDAGPEILSGPIPQVLAGPA